MLVKCDKCGYAIHVHNRSLDSVECKCGSRIPLGNWLSGANVPGNWFDRQALGYSDWMLWVHLLLCQCPGIVVGLLFLMACATEQGKAVGVRLLQYSGIGLGIAILLRILLFAAAQQ